MLKKIYEDILVLNFLTHKQKSHIVNDAELILWKNEQFNFPKASYLCKQEVIRHLRKLLMNYCLKLFSDSNSTWFTLSLIDQPEVLQSNVKINLE